MTEKVLMFCTCCFASEQNGSWGYSIERVEYSSHSTTHCYNCGSSGSGVLLPEFAIESIRNQASWVGKRYYPNDEDKDISRELKLLRSKIDIFPGRTVQLSETLNNLDDNSLLHLKDGAKYYTVTQKTKVGSTSTHLVASNYEEAVEKSKTVLPYYSETELS